MNLPTQSERLRILLVEDNQADAALVRHILNAHQHDSQHLDHVTRLDEALDRLVGATYSVALLDLNLPDAQGPETFTVIHDAAPGLPVIILTGMTDQALAVQLVQMGAQDYLPKGDLGTELINRAIHYAMARKDIEKKLEEAAHYDSLTGLPNRALFHERLDRALARARRKRHDVSLLYMDVDRFKAVNDTLGHAAGDELLGQLGARFSAVLRKNDTIARMGGDEFTVIIEDAENFGVVRGIAEKLLALFEQPFCVAGETTHVGTSIGIAHSAQGAVDADTLLRRSDDAMYRAKDCGGNSYRVYREAADMSFGLHDATESPAVETLGVAQDAALIQRAGDILLVDDSPGDRRLIAEAFREARLGHRLRMVSGGDKAIACLRRKDEFASLPFPRLILLDLNMPGNNGFDVLREIRASARLARIPVIVLSTSDAPADAAKAYRLGANGYIVKPDDFAQTVKAIDAVVRYWMDFVRLPPA